MKLMRMVAIGLATLFANQARADLAPSQFWMLNGLRFKLQNTPAGSSKLAADSVQRRILGELGIPVDGATYVDDWAKSFSPLLGAMVWHNGLIYNLYFYGPQDDPFIKLVQFVFHVPEDAHELNITQQNAESFKALLESPHFGDFVRTYVGTKLDKQTRSQLATPKSAAEQFSGLLALKIESAGTSKVFPHYFIGLVLSAAWYRLVLGTDVETVPANQAVVRAHESNDELKTLIEGFVHEPRSSMRLRALDRATTQWASAEDRAMAVFAWLFFTPYPPLILQGWHMTCKTDRKEDYPDCGENTLHNLFDFLVFDPLNAEKYLPEKYLAINGLKPLAALQDFYKENPLVSASTSKSVRQQWADLVSGIPNVAYGIKEQCDLSPSSDMVLKIVGYLLGIADETKQAEQSALLQARPSQTPKLTQWKDLEQLLSTAGRKITIEQETERTVLSIKEAELDRKIILIMGPGHAEASFPPAIEALPNSIKTRISEPVVRLLLNFDPLTTDPALQNSQIYTRPLDDMGTFDKTIVALLDKNKETPLMARHWFAAAGTKWLSMPDDAPSNILKFSWKQISTNGPFEKAAKNLMQLISKHPELHEAYLDELTEIAQKSSETFEKFEEDFAFALEEAKAANIDLSLVFLPFIAKLSEPGANKALDLVTTAIGADPQKFMKIAKDIAHQAVESTLFAKRITPLVINISPKLGVTPFVAKFFIKVAAAPEQSDLKTFAINWLALNARDLGMFIGLHQIESTKLIDLFLNFEPKTDEEQKILQDFFENVVARQGASPYLADLYLHLVFSKSDFLRKKAANWFDANAQNLVKLGREGKVEFGVLLGFFTALKNQSDNAQEIAQKLFDNVIMPLEATPNLARMCLGIIAADLDFLYHRAFTWIVKNEAIICTLIQNNKIGTERLKNFFTSVNSKSLVAQTMAQNIFERIAKRPEAAPKLASILPALTVQAPYLRQQIIDWLIKNANAPALKNFFASFAADNQRIALQLLRQASEHLESASMLTYVYLELSSDLPYLNEPALAWLRENASTVDSKKVEDFFTYFAPRTAAVKKEGLETFEKIIGTLKVTPGLVVLCLLLSTNESITREQKLGWLVKNIEGIATLEREQEYIASAIALFLRNFKPQTDAEKRLFETFAARFSKPKEA